MSQRRMGAITAAPSRVNASSTGDGYARRIGRPWGDRLLDDGPRAVLKPAQYNIRVGISIAGSNNGTIGIERRGVPSGCQGRKGKLERLESVGSESLCFGGS